MHITSTYISYYNICKRKLWLFANGINMEQTSDIVYDGKMLHETSYPQRPDRYSEMLLSAEYKGLILLGQLDYYDSKNHIVHEIKRSDKVDEAHIWQVKFYLWLLKLNSVDDAVGLLEYPKLRKTDDVFLKEEDCKFLEGLVGDINLLIQEEKCPNSINKGICKKCSYYDLCYATE